MYGVNLSPFIDLDFMTDSGFIILVITYTFRFLSHFYQSDFITFLCNKGCQSPYRPIKLYIKVKVFIILNMSSVIEFNL